MLMSTSCKKDKPLTLHSGLTRINYTVNNPLEMPHIEFAFNSTYDLADHTLCSVSLAADGNAASLSLKLMLEDVGGNRTDQHPFAIAENSIVKNDELNVFEYNFSGNLGSSTNIIGGADIHRIGKVLIFINSGIEGKVAEGYFWLDKVEFSADN
jgi:hypothetical protein